MNFNFYKVVSDWVVDEYSGDNNTNGFSVYF